MNEEQSGATAVVEPAPQPAEPAKETDDELEYEIELNTPFGIVELEFEPRARRDRKERARKERAERKAAEKAAAKARELAEREAKGRRSLLLPVLIFLIIAAAVAIAVWLFARPGDDDDDLPEYLATPLEGDVGAPPKSLIAGARGRGRDAIRQGRKASRDAQREQEQRYREMTGGH
jgi:hypothetical protein